LLELSPLAGHNHVDLSAAALRTHKPRTPFEDGHLRAVSPGLLSRIGLDLTPTCPTPDDQPHVGRGGVAEGHRRTGLGFHLAAPPLSSCGSRRRIHLGGGKGSRAGFGLSLTRIAAHRPASIKAT
jgi:hypothetical protein